MPKKPSRTTQKVMTAYEWAQKAKPMPPGFPKKKKKPSKPSAKKKAKP